MPIISHERDRLDRCAGRRPTRKAGNSVRRIALALGLLLAGCAAPSSGGRSPYTAPNAVDLGHAGGGGGGGGGGGAGGM
jgi:hypothetical protein